MTHCVVEAVLRSGVHAILSKGWSDRLQSKTTDASEPEELLPSQIYPIPSVPHDWLFQRIDAACHHGGAGTTGASLRGLSRILMPTHPIEPFCKSRHTNDYPSILW
jgi:sterol 3beta-glucosyltransferase